MNKTFYSKDNNTWDLSAKRGIGGEWFFCPNLSLGYHGLLRQYWEKYAPQTEINVLLVGDNTDSKAVFEKNYPHWRVTTTDLYPDLKSADIKCDIIFDTCSRISVLEKKYDIIINQANLEHMYDPFQAMLNLSNALNTDGLLLTHTHPPRMPYHSYPRDYFRFMIDWWYDLPKYIIDLELYELYEWNNEHVFTMYKKK